MISTLGLDGPPVGPQLLVLTQLLGLIMGDYKNVLDDANRKILGEGYEDFVNLININIGGDKNAQSKAYIGCLF